MNTNKKTGRIVGVLFLTVMVTYTLCAVLLYSILNDPDYLFNLFANKTQVITGVLLELINGIAYIGIAVLVFPILKQLNTSLALGYVGFRILEFAMQFVSDISILSLLTLSQEFVKADTLDASSLQTLSPLLLAMRYWANQMVFISYGLGAIIFYFLLYQLKLIPRFLSVWGLIGAPLVLINSMLEIFGFNPGLILGFQMGLNEIILGIWLMVKGFNSSAIVSGAAKIDINKF